MWPVHAHEPQLNRYNIRVKFASARQCAVIKFNMVIASPVLKISFDDSMWFGS